MNKQMENAVKTFKEGGIVIFPTDTAIGIGCRLDNEVSIKRLFQIRKRPEDKSLLVLVSSIEMAQKYLLPIPDEVKNKLIKPYWPGMLTLVLKCSPNKVLFPVRDERNTVGVRFPKNMELVKLIEKIGVPIVAPSANFTGEKTPFRFSDLSSEIIKQANLVLDDLAVSGEKNVSTIIDSTVKPWKIIRQGTVKIPNL
jgi:L-threonylcarbamoyladenylate synthase